MSKKVCVATLHTGNTLTVHSHAFFKGRPTVVEDEGVIEWLKNHPNFTVKFKDVPDGTSNDKVVTDTRKELRKEGEYVAPVFGEDPATLEESPAADTEPEPTSTPKAPVRRGASRVSR